MFDLKIYAPDPEDDDDADSVSRQWHVIGDLRVSDNQSNHDLSDATMVQLKGIGLTVDADPEWSCSYFYCPNEATAVAVKAIAEQVATNLAEELNACWGIYMADGSVVMDSFETHEDAEGWLLDKANRARERFIRQHDIRLAVADA